MPVKSIIKELEKPPLYSLCVLTAIHIVGDFTTLLKRTLQPKENSNALRADTPAGEGESFVAAAGFGTLVHAHPLAFGRVGGIRRHDSQSYTIGLLVVLERISSAL